MATAEQVTQLIELTMTLLQERTGGTGTGGDTADGAVAATVTTKNTNSKAKRPDRPVVNCDIDDREWALFEDTWERYKHMIGVTEVASLRMELRSACSSEVNKMLFEFVGPTTLNACTEAELLAHIKTVAVKQVHHEVHQMTFHGMMQQDGESITRWSARLKAQAFLCKFEVQSSTNPVTFVSYADKAVATQLVIGLRNLEHKRKVLAEAATLTTLQSKIERLQLLETTEESADLLSRMPHMQPSVAAAQKSQYKKQQRIPPAEGDAKTAGDPDTVDPCKGCGNTSHPRGKPLTRANCPAFDKKCSKCNKKGHFARVCMQSNSAPARDTGNDPPDEPLQDVESGASVSFSFAGQDFRPRARKDGNP